MKTTSIPNAVLTMSTAVLSVSTAPLATSPVTVAPAELVAMSGGTKAALKTTKRRALPENSCRRLRLMCRNRTRMDTGPDKASARVTEIDWLTGGLEPGEPAGSPAGGAETSSLTLVSPGENLRSPPISPSFLQAPTKRSPSLDLLRSVWTKRPLDARTKSNSCGDATPPGVVPSMARSGLIGGPERAGRGADRTRLCARAGSTLGV